jgi:hypothetical protein
MADDHDDDPDLTDRERELRRWNRPYKFQEFPKYLHRVTPTTEELPPVDPRMRGVTTTTEHDRTVQVDLVYQAGIVDTAEVEADLQAVGWATQVETAREAAREAVQRETQRRALETKEQQVRTFEEAFRRVLDEREERLRNEKVEQEREAAEKPARRKAEREGVVMPQLDELGWTPSQWALKACVGPAVALDYLSGETIDLSLGVVSN